MKHTKGPWNATIYSGAFDQPLITSDEGVIARLHSFPERQHEINAKLIAAAPDLLKELQNILKYNKDLKRKYQISPSLIDEIERIIKKATE